MSTRLLRKLKKPENNDINKLKDLNLNNNQNENEDEEEEEEEEVQSNYVNKFNFLENEDIEINDKNNDVDDDDDNDDQDLSKKEIVSNKSKNKSKKKKEKKNKIIVTESSNVGNNNNNNDFKFISDNIENNPLFNENEVDNEVIQTKEPKINRSLLQIEAKNLNCDNEMIRIFGAKVVNAEKAQNNRNSSSKRALLSKLTKFNTIVGKKPTWPEYRKNGLQMKVVSENNNNNNNNNNEIEFSFEHLKEYQTVQFNFLDAVESLDHNNIIMVLHSSPFHIDSLIQLSDVSRINDDTQMAADLIERALYAFQNTFHPQFNLQKNNFKIDYNRIENRGFFICLFKHLLFTGAKACYRTSLELCKLLLSLDITNDPLAIVLMIDFYALRSKKYKYFIDFYNYFNQIKHLNLLPNMQYSIALAYFQLSIESTQNKLEYLNEANKQLREALLKFPGLLLELLDKCGVQPDKEVETSSIFAKHSHLNTPDGLKYLFNLYIIRMNSEWKIPEVLSWLEKNVKLIINDSKNLNKIINDNKSKFKSLFAKIPSNVLRHIILSDSKEMALTLPPEFASKACYTFDPIPPTNTIVSYKRPDKPRTVATYANASSLLTFFRSLLPSFNSEDRVTEEELAAGGAVAGNGNLRNNLGNIAAQLREFLANLQPTEEYENLDPTNQNNDDNIEEGHEFD